MSTDYRPSLRYLYRDRENGIFLGVCAGIADIYALRVSVLRVIAVLALLLWFWPVAILYVVAGVLLKDRPLRYRGRQDESGFWRSGRYHSGG